MSTELDKNQGLVEAALEIARQRRNILLLAQQALRAGDVKEADRLLTELIPDEEVHRATPRQYDGAGRRLKGVLTFPANR